MNRERALGRETQSETGADPAWAKEKPTSANGEGSSGSEQKVQALLETPSGVGWGALLRPGTCWRVRTSSKEERA